MAFDVLAALHWREMTGDGQALEVAVAEAYASVDDWASLRYQGAGSINRHYGSLDRAGWLYCFAPTSAVEIALILAATVRIGSALRF